MARLEPGDVGVINASQSGLKLSTGVMVMYVDDESFAFALPEGHMFSGWITFSAFADGEIRLHLDHIRDFLGDREFLLGDRLQGPDFGMAYVLQLAERLGQLDAYPTLSAYLHRLTARPAFQRALERAGEQEGA